MTRITIYLHNSNTFSADIPNYDAAALAQSLNDPKLLMISVGDVVVNKNTVQLILPTPIETETPIE